MSWLRSQDSNLDQGIQSPLCYRYTTPQPGFSRPLLVPEAGLEPARGQPLSRF